MKPLKKQTSQTNRTKASLAAGGGGVSLSVGVAYVLGLFGLEPDPELVALIAGVIMWAAGRVVSRLGQ